MLTKAKPKPTKRPAKKPISSSAHSRAKGRKPSESTEVLTLSEAAEFLRISPDEVVRLVGPSGLPGRQVGEDWRFLKSALCEWLSTPPTSNKATLLAQAGSWKDDPYFDEMLEGIYRRRGRPMVEEQA